MHCGVVGDCFALLVRIHLECNGVRVKVCPRVLEKGSGPRMCDGVCGALQKAVFPMSCVGGPGRISGAYHQHSFCSHKSVCSLVGWRSHQGDRTSQQSLAGSGKCESYTLPYGFGD